jgi:hypothetical protein
VPTARWRVLFVLVVLATIGAGSSTSTSPSTPPLRGPPSRLSTPSRTTPPPLSPPQSRYHLWGLLSPTRQGPADPRGPHGRQQPVANPFPERLIGSMRRECLDHVVILSERHLRHRLTRYFAYHRNTRTDLSLAKDAPDGRPVEPPERGEVASTDRRSRRSVSSVLPARGFAASRPASLAHHSTASPFPPPATAPLVACSPLDQGRAEFGPVEHPPHRVSWVSREGLGCLVVDMLPVHGDVGRMGFWRRTGSRISPSGGRQPPRHERAHTAAMSHASQTSAVRLQAGRQPLMVNGRSLNQLSPGRPRRILGPPDESDEVAQKVTGRRIPGVRPPTPG